MSTREILAYAKHEHKNASALLIDAYKNHYPEGTIVRWEHGNHWRYGTVQGWASWQGADNFELLIKSESGARFRKSPRVVRICQ